MGLVDTPRIHSRLDLLYMVTREFSARLELDLVLQRVLAATIASVGAYDAHLLLFDPKGKLEKSLFIDTFEVKQPSEATLEIVSTIGLAGWVREQRQSVLIAD